MVVGIGTPRANANSFVATIGSVSCSTILSNGDNELHQSQHKSKHFRMGKATFEALQIASYI